MQTVQVPYIYFWTEKVSDKPVKMTAAFKLGGQNYGMSFPMQESKIQNKTNKRKLIEKVKDTLDIIIHHGRKVLDSKGDINPRLVNDAEAERFWLDKLWRHRLAAFYKIVKVKEIDEKKAREIGLL